MAHAGPSRSKTGASRLVVSVGVALAVVAVGVVAYLFGLGFFQTPEPTPTIVAVAPSLPPTAIPPTNTPAPTSTATWTPTPTSTPTAIPTPELGTSNIYVEYILDASGSMNEALPGGTLKLAVAKKLLTENLQAFRPETNVGLRAYGHRVYYQQTAKSCQDIELIAPVDKGQMETIVTWLQDFKAQGMTPLAESIRQAMDDFTFDPAHINSIVLLSDGIETCGGDPCGLVEELKAEGINFTIHVIGLQVDDPTRAQLQCIAQAAGGSYHDANSEQDLAEALGSIQEDVTEDEVIVPFGVNTPTPMPPIPTDTAMPPTSTATPIPSTATPTPKPATAKPVLHGRIAFVTDRHEPYPDDCEGICNLEIYTMNADGSNQVRVTNNAVYDDSPTWSPNGSRIAFYSNRKHPGYDKYEIYVMNADGTSPVQITDLVTNYVIGISWSPDSQRIAFGAEDRLPVDVLTINTGGSNMINLTANGAWDDSPSWSPDGKQIAFVSDRHGNDEIYVMNADGRGVARLTNNAASERGPAWSPTGKLIAFASNRDGNSQIYVMNTDGSGVKRLTNGPGTNWGPAWSPDGSSIAFVSDRDGNSEIYVMTASGSGITRLTNSPANEWGPDWTK